MGGVGESSSAGRASAMMDSDAQMARRLQKLLDEEDLQDVSAYQNREDPRKYDKQSGVETRGAMNGKGKGKGKSDDDVRGNDRISQMRPEDRGREHKHSDSTSQKRGKLTL